MRILTAGGGSGGHVTPVVAVLRELQARYPEAEIRFWCDKGFEKQARALIAHHDETIRVDTITSGKLRRYHALSWLHQLTRLRTIVWPNVRDGFKVTVGIIQATFKMIAWRPDIVFSKGGFVCLPIGVAAKLLRVPLVIHDSDAHPGLTNRILARWADRILTGAPLEYYPYPKDISRYVGIPIQVGLEGEVLSQRGYKNHLGLDMDRHLIVCTGGGLGATRINLAVVVAAHELLARNYSIVLITGQKNYDETLEALGGNVPEHFVVVPFISGNLHEYFMAADVVVTRAGATTLLELAALERPTVIIPNVHLTGGHQRKNAAVYAEANAAIVLDEYALEAKPSILTETITELVDDPKRLKRLSRNISHLAKPDAAKETVDVLEEVLRAKGILA